MIKFEDTEHAQKGPAQLLDILLGAEVSSARIEAALDADPVVADLWRSEAAVTEAASSIGLEDVRISEHDLLLRVASNGAAGIDARAVEDALDVLRFLRAPGDALHDPEGVAERIARLSRRAGSGPGEAGEAMILSPAEARESFAFCRGRAPIFEAVMAARHYALLTDRASPVAERMIFVAAEQAARAGQGVVRAHQEDVLRGLGGRISARWVALPSIALTSRSFRIWSPSGARGLRNILEAIGDHQSREIGRLITVRAWVGRMREAGQGRHGRSRLRDAAFAFGSEPVLTSARLADLIGVTQRGAINLLDQLVQGNLVHEITRRRAARIWSTPMLAERLAGRAPARQTVAEPERKPGSRAQDLAEVDIDAAMAEFDKTMNEADAILERVSNWRKNAP